MSGGVGKLRAAFTLIELLVVVALIAVLSLSFAMALRDSGGNALATAQTTMATLVGTARAQAAVQQTEAILAIYASPPPAGDPERYLRMLQVFRNSTPDATTPTWVPVGNPVTLPPGVYVVPTSTAGLLASGVIWPSNPPILSTVGPAVNLRQPTGTPFGGAITAFTFQFNPDGTLPILDQQRVAYARLIVATGALANSRPQFTNASAVRGLLVRSTGAVTFVNAASDF